VSLLLHACLALTLCGAFHWTARRKSGHRGSWLNVELSGILSHRQVAAQQQRVVVGAGFGGPRADERKPGRTETARKQLPGRPTPVPLGESPVDMPDAVKLPALPSSLADALSSAGSLPRGGADYGQQQQLIARREAADDSAYSVQLTKQIRAHLVYPFDARKKRIEGVSQICFVVTESGEIKPGTLAVKKSSGYAVLDASALKSAQTSAPFPKPPRELAVSIEVAFEVD
jgi:protein TonB